MAKFTYKGKDASGNAVSGVISASSEAEAGTKLRAKKIRVSSVKKKAGAKGFNFEEFMKKANAKPIGTADIAIFSRQFSSMINAGLPVLQCLSILSDQTDNYNLKKTLAALKDDIGSGGNLSDSMEKFPKVFDELYTNMIRSGELGGVLDVILERLSVYMEKAEALKRKIKSAMMYPMIVVSVAVLVIIFLMVKVIPTFEDVFNSFGKELPPLTAAVVAMSRFLQNNIILLAGGLFAFFTAFKAVSRTKKGRFILDKLLLKAPVFGELITKASVAKFSRTLGTLLKSGVPILEALETVAKTAGNKVVEAAINAARASIREGQGMTGPLKDSGVFPPMVIQMVSVGEETGKIDEMLMRAADFYEEEVDTAVEGLSSMLEPLIIVFLGVSIGTIVVAMFMPMFELGNVVSE
jgi:type IV pilus assembly protein PilC